MSRITLQVPEVHCEHCKSSIEGAVSELDGIDQVEVAIADATVSVEYDDDVVGLETIKGVIEEQGYAVTG